jgi:WD40 repeat protein
MSSKNIFPFPKITKVDMQRQRSMIKKIIKLKNGNIAVASYGAVISIWNPNKKIIVQAWRSKGGVWDLIELDNEDLIAICNQENYISVYKYDEDEDSYQDFQNVEWNGMLSALIKLNNNKFVFGTMHNIISFWEMENNGKYKKEKDIQLEPKGDCDCIYCFIKISNGNFISTALATVNLIDANSIKVIKSIRFSEPSCSYEDSKKHIWIGNSPGLILIVDSELNQLKELEAHGMQVNKFVEYNNNIISASTDFKMKIWDSTSFECLHTVDGYGEITAICLFDEKCLISAQGIPQTEDIEDYDEDDLLQFLVFYEN